MSNTPQRRQPFVLTATVDFPDDVGRGAYTPELLDELMATFAGIGVKRIHWLYYGDIDPDSYWAGSIFDWDGLWPADAEGYRRAPRGGGTRGTSARHGDSRRPQALRSGRVGHGPRGFPGTRARPT